MCAVHRLESQAAAIFDYTIGNSNIPETTVALSPKLDAPVARGLANAFIGRVEHRAFLVSTSNVTVTYRDVVGGPRKAQSIGTLQTNSVVPR